MKDSDHGTTYTYTASTHGTTYTYSALHIRIQHRLKGGCTLPEALKASTAAVSASAMVAGPDSRVWGWGVRVEVWG